MSRPQIAPTSEQSAIIDAAVARDASMMISAFAGAAKTTTLSLLMWERFERGLTTPALYIVFNVRNKKEAEEPGRFPPNVIVKTMNGLGHSALGRALGKRLIVDERKLGKIITDVLKGQPGGADGEAWPLIRELVSAAMLAGLIPDKYPHYKGLVPDDEAIWNELTDMRPNATLIGLARSALVRSVRLAFDGTISYDDQIYIPTLFGGSFTTYPLVLVDEAQDLSPLQHLMVRKTASERLIVVGDPKQAIYSWRGASGTSMDDIRKLRPEWIDLPLATTFRVPRAIVVRNIAHAPGFTAALSNADGFHVRLPHIGSRTWSWRDVDDDGLPVAVLCRNNAPLLRLAFKLLRQRIPVVMTGRDIGKGLVQLAKKLLPDAATLRAECAATIRAWMDNETVVRPEKAESVGDRGECLLAVLESDNITCAGDLIASLESLFASTAGHVTLSSIHRAKGLEWDTVVHLDPWRIPSKRVLASGSPDEISQEANLKYVCETRTKRTLIEADLEDFQ